MERVVGYIFVIALFAVLVIGGARMDNGEPFSHHHPVACQEDESCWDCHTMGNRICGPQAR